MSNNSRSTTAPTPFATPGALDSPQRLHAYAVKEAQRQPSPVVAMSMLRRRRHNLDRHHQHTSLHTEAAQILQEATMINTENLKKLATYLEKLPLNYEHFGMKAFLRGADDPSKVEKYALQNGGVHTCGTAACAVGHGPSAGILVPRSMLNTAYISWKPENVIDWDAYTGLFLGEDWQDENRDAFEWMFGGSWGYSDNTHRGAAARIRYFLDHGVPEDFNDSCEGEHYLEEYESYIVTA